MNNRRLRRIKGRFFLLFLLLFLTGCSLSPGGEVIDQIDAEYAQDEGEQEVDVMEDGNISEEDCIWVHICGQVREPGVYSFPEGSRVFDAVEAAGGFTDKADCDLVNLAMNLSDEGKIYIPSKEEQNESVDRKENISDGRMNVNTASLDDLMTLPGIGEKRAESILKLREERGSFQTVEELLDAEGIKEGIFEKIKDLIKV